MASDAPEPTGRPVPDSPFQQLGGEAVVRRLAAEFYRQMAEHERPLAELHSLDADGRVAEATVARFSEFFVEWLGGPPLFSSRYGHPRLRMRHAHVPIDEAMRDAWLRAMRAAMDEVGVHGDVRAFLDQRLADLANFLRNTAG